MYLTWKLKDCSQPFILYIHILTLGSFVQELKLKADKTNHKVGDLSTCQNVFGQHTEGQITLDG